MKQDPLEPTPLFNGIWGCMPHEAFAAHYEPCPRTRQGTRQADVLMESAEGHPGWVRLYPAHSSIAVYPWRSFWRKKRANP